MNKWALILLVGICLVAVAAAQEDDWMEDFDEDFDTGGRCSFIACFRRCRATGFRGGRCQGRRCRCFR